MSDLIDDGEGEWVDCMTCAGDGDVPDRSENTWPCADPDSDERVVCPDCGGDGGWWE